MHYPVDFKCKVENSENIPASIVESTGISFYKAHTDSSAMSTISEEKKRREGDCFCKIPFCLSVEAEALGANVIITNTEIGPRFEGYKCAAIEELLNITEINLNIGRISEVLRCVQILSSKGSIVALNVEGPFTILGMLIDSTVLYKEIKKNRMVLDSVLQVLENSIVEYIIKGIQKGAKIISYADPTGALEILGPQLYKEISGRISHNILKRVENYLDGTIVHLCAKTSIALVKTKFCKAKPIKVTSGMTYGEALCKFIEDKEIKFIGHNCMTNTPIQMQSQVVWKIDLL